MLKMFNAYFLPAVLIILSMPAKKDLFCVYNPLLQSVEPNK